MSPERRHRAAVLAASALWVAAFTAILLSWIWRAPEGFECRGVIGGDTPGYLNLPITLMGWTLATVRSPAVLENGMRLLLGVACYLALARWLEMLLGRGTWFWAGFAVVGLGAGLSWAAALGLAGEREDFFAQ